MSGQVQKHGGRDDGDEPEDGGLASGGGQAQADTGEIDDLLDEIDDVLEQNAEQFVKGYVQKGGQ